MMLLTAIILLIGFIALAGMVSRVSLLAQQAGREQDRPLLREVEPLQKGLNDALDTSASGKGLGSITGLYVSPYTSYDGAAKAVLEQMRQLEGARGFIARWTMDCDLTSGAKDVAKGYATLSLSDGELRVSLKSAYFTRPAGCPVYSG
jgi:hypothetical protein